MAQYLKNIFDYATKDLRENLNNNILKATSKAQKKYGFSIGTGEHATWNNEADAFKHAYLSWYLTHNYGRGVAEWLGNMHEDETPNAPSYERNMDLWNNQIGREVPIDMWQRYGDKMKNFTKEEISELASDLIMEKMKNGELITNPYKDKRKFENMEKERLKDSDRVFYEDEYWDDMDENERKRYSTHYADYKNRILNKFPTKAELEEKVLKGELIYVNNYTRSDGTKVSGYYRKYPRK